MPTDGLVTFSHMMNEMKQIGFDTVYHRQKELGDRVRSLLSMKGFKSVAADGYGAPGVVVCYTDDPGIQNGSKFAELGLQIAAGVPLRCGEPDGFSTFRLGLFGLDKLNNIDAAVVTLEKALDQVLA
jgi:aspartate aminotransferase-like enzyme